MGPPLVVVLGLVLGQWLGDNIPSLLFFAAITAAAWYGGWLAGLLATAVSSLAVAFFFFKPCWSIRVEDPGEQLELVLFILVGLVVNSLIAARRGAMAAASALREADRRKDEFLAMLAHELRNPLGPIRNALHILRAAGNDRATAAQVTDIMERQVQQMVRLVDDLMDVSRISKGKMHLQKERVELAAVVRSAVESSGPLVEAAGHRLAVTLPEEPVWLEGDQLRLAQVFSNLLNNAARYTKHSGRIELTARREDPVVAVTVKDNGIGIPLAMLPHVFELFTQVNRAEEKARGGLGIGLSLVRQLVEMHGGSVQAHSEGPDQGSEFTVRLPVIQDQGINEQLTSPLPPGSSLATSS
jgi:signal transduction histidine kinase